VCAGGHCQSGTPTDCDDGNTCTTDSCDRATGCVHTDTTAACDGECSVPSVISFRV
jgi:hypothetical protein